MANELALSGLTIAFTKTNVPSVSMTAGSLSVTVSGTTIMDSVQDVGTSEEAILLGDVATGGYWFVQNMDATNFITLRSATGVTGLIKLLAGEWAIFRTNSGAAAPFIIADTGACKVRLLRLAA